MTCKMTMFAVLLGHFVLDGVLSCDQKICLMWKISSGVLTVTCAMENVLYRLSLDDPSGQTRDQCLPKLTCSSVTAHDHRMSPLWTGFSVELPISTEDSLYGTWQCHHGSSGTVATTTILLNSSEGILYPELTSQRRVAITSPIDVVSEFDEFSAGVMKTGKEIYETTAGITELSFPRQVFTTDILITHGSNDATAEQKDDILRTLFAPLAALLISLFVVFAVCNIWISRKCSSYNTTVGLHKGEDSNPLPRTSMGLSETHDDAKYEEIDETKMIRNISPVNHHQILLHHDPSNSSSSSSPSVHSYLEVIGDNYVSNSYEKFMPNNNTISGNYSDMFTFNLTQRCKDTINTNGASLSKVKSLTVSAPISSDSKVSFTTPSTKSCPELYITLQVDDGKEMFTPANVQCETILSVL